jgi:hypothetical protein
MYSIDLPSERSLFAYIATLLHKTLSTDAPDPFLPILQRQEIDWTTQNVALSLSNALQNAVNVNSTTFTGIAVWQEVFVHVQ